MPVPIPNTEAKPPIAEGSAGPARARVGRRRPFFHALKARKTGPSAIAARIAAIVPALFLCKDSGAHRFNIWCAPFLLLVRTKASYAAQQNHDRCKGKFVQNDILKARFDIFAPNMI